MERPKTYFIDIDGCLLRNFSRGAGEQWATENAELIEGFNEWQDAVEKTGARFVLVTARPDVPLMRRELEATLRSFGIYWHELIMGVTNGQRVLIDDRPPIAIHKERNHAWDCFSQRESDQTAEQTARVDT